MLLRPRSSTVADTLSPYTALFRAPCGAFSFLRNNLQPAGFAVTEDNTIAARLAQIRCRIDDAALRAGRTAGSVALLPVSKTFGETAIREAVAAGVRRFGENKAQEIRSKYEPLADCGIDWVMIGHLQTNKAKDVARMSSEVQTLDRSEEHPSELQ